MKERLKNPVIPDYTPKNQKTAEVKLTFSPCCNCGKTITDGYYGRHQDGGTCSKSCEQEEQKKEKYPGHSATDYWKRQLGDNGFNDPDDFATNL